jgi:predicted transcriptional regulator
LDNFISYENEFLKNCTIIEANENKIKLANINNMDMLSVGKGLKINKIQYTKMKNIYTETDTMEQDLIDLK